MRNATPVLLILSLILASLSSCSVASFIQLEDSVAGSVNTRITMDPLLREYLGDLAEVQGADVDESTSFFDTAALTAGFATADGISLTGLILEAPETLRILASFADIQRIFPGRYRYPEQPCFLLPAFREYRNLEYPHRCP